MVHGTDHEIEVRLQVVAEEAQIGRAVGEGLDFSELVVLPVLHHCPFLLHEAGHEGDGIDLQQLVDGVVKADAVHVDVDGSLDAATARFLHATPVLESVADEGVGRDGGDGIVEVAHLDGVERHLDDCSVGAIFLHRDPVARAQHVVGRELYAGDEAEDRILEDQHQDGR